MTTEKKEGLKKLVGELEQMVPRVRSTVNFQLTFTDIEGPNLGKRVTVPNDGYTIRELLDRFTSGVMPNVRREPMYPTEDMTLDDIDVEKLGQYDLFDKDQVLVQMKEIILRAAKQQAAQRTAAEKGDQDRGDQSSEKKSKSYQYDKGKKGQGKERERPGPSEASERPRKSGTTPNKDQG